MTDFQSLYQKFQFKDNEAENLRELHFLSKSFQEEQQQHLFSIKTIISEYEDATMINNEVQNGKLV